MGVKEFYIDGVMLIAAGDFNGAIGSFHKALEADSLFYMAHLGLSQALDKQGKVDEAITQARRAIEIAPEEPLAHASLSRLLQQKGLIPEAEKEMAESMRLQGET